MNIKSNIQIFSLGHSNFPLVTFLKKLTDNKIQLIADCRTHPISRFCPHYSQNALQKALNSENIQYLYKGKNLGGKGVNVDYEEAIDELVTLAKQGKRVCLLCVEKSHLNCHRFIMLTPSFEERGILVVHIEYNENDK